MSHISAHDFMTGVDCMMNEPIEDISIRKGFIFMHNQEQHSVWCVTPILSHLHDASVIRYVGL